eukprot:s6259_g3.t1
MVTSCTSSSISGNGACTRDMMCLALLDRPASQALDDEALAMYIVLRMVPRPRQFLLATGLRYYFLQFPSDAVTAAMIRAQILGELEDTTMAGTPAFFRYMLEQPYREDFYEAIYLYIADSMTADPRPITSIHPALFPLSAPAAVSTTDFYEAIYLYIADSMTADPRPITSIHPALFPLSAPAAVSTTAHAGTSDMASSAVEPAVPPGAAVAADDVHSPATTVLELDGASDTDATMDYGGHPFTWDLGA